VPPWVTGTTPAHEIVNVDPEAAVDMLVPPARVTTVPDAVPVSPDIPIIGIISP